MRKVVIVIIVLAVITGGVFLFIRFRNGQRANALSDLQTVAIERGELVASIGATGTVRANQTANLLWQTTGSVSDVNVSVGDQVSTDQIMAELEETSLPQTVIMAGVDLVNARNDLEDLLEPPTDLAVKQAEQAIAKAEETVRDLERYVNNLQTASTQSDIDQARASVTLAKDQLDKAREDYAPYENKPEDNLVRATLLGRLGQAQAQYDAAARRLNNLLGTANPVDLAVAEADLALAQAHLEDAQEKYEELLAGASTDDIAAAEARVAAAQATVDLQHIAAPFTGTITQIDSKPGDQVSPGTLAFRLDDLSRLLVDVQVSEIDINNVQEGQDVIVTFDAIPGKEFQGVVSEVALVGTSLQDVVDFIVTVELTDPDESVKPGMTAAVNIAVSQLEDVLLIPNRAVRVLDGNRVVYILKDGVPTPVEVSLGASSEVNSQVVEGDIQEGDLVVLNPPIVFEQNGPPPFVQRQ
jgi:HlyD family secretion protein